MLIRITAFLCAFYIITNLDFVLSDSKKKCEPCKDFTRTGTSPYEALWNLKNVLKKQLPGDIASKKMLLTSDDIKTAEGYFLEYCRSNCRHLFEGKDCEKIDKSVSKKGKIFRFKSLDEEKKYTEPAKKIFRSPTKKPDKNITKKKVTETLLKKPKKQSITPESVKSKKYKKYNLDEQYAALYHDVLFGPRISKLENFPRTTPGSSARALGLLTELATATIATDFAGLTNTVNTDKMVSVVPDQMSVMKNSATSISPFEENQESISDDVITPSDVITDEEILLRNKDIAERNGESVTEMNLEMATEPSLEPPKDNTMETVTESQANDNTTQNNIGSSTNSEKNLEENDTNSDDNSGPDSEDTSSEENQENLSNNEKQTQKPEKVENKEDESENQNDLKPVTTGNFLEDIIYSFFGGFLEDDSDLKTEIIKCAVDAILSEVENVFGIQPGTIKRESCGGKNNTHLDFGIASLVKNLIDQETQLNLFGDKGITIWQEPEKPNPNLNLLVGGVYEQPSLYGGPGVGEGPVFGHYPNWNYNNYFGPENWSGIRASDNVYDDYSTVDRGGINDSNENLPPVDYPDVEYNFGEDVQDNPDFYTDKEDSPEEQSLGIDDSVNAAMNFMHWRSLSDMDNEEDEDQEGSLSEENESEEEKRHAYESSDERTEEQSEESLDDENAIHIDFKNNDNPAYRAFLRKLHNILNSEDNSASEESEEN